MPPTTQATEGVGRWQRVRELHHSRSRRCATKWIAGSCGLLFAAAVSRGLLDPTDAFSTRRLENARRFLGELRPYPWRSEPPGDLGAWLAEHLLSQGLPALAVTAAVAWLALLLATFAASLCAPIATRAWCQREPAAAPGDPGYALEPRRAAARWVMRAALLIARALPEVVLAYVLLGLLGPRSAWPLILALAIHNAGILGRLQSETLENTPGRSGRALANLGASRLGALWAGPWIGQRGRHLLFACYRFETCVRESTVLGLFGVVSLGYWVADARAKQFYDELLLWIVLGASLVGIADGLSRSWRRSLREPGVPPKPVAPRG